MFENKLSEIFIFFQKFLHIVVFDVLKSWGEIWWELRIEAMIK